MKEVTNPFESLYNTIAFDVKDWSTNKRDAWIYGIIIGWESDEPEITEDSFQQFNQQFKWTRETWNRLLKLHEEFLKYRKMSEAMTYKEAKKYLYQGYIVRNDDFEYKAKGKDIFCRQIGTEAWNTLFRIGEYEKKMQWEVVGKK